MSEGMPKFTVATRCLSTCPNIEDHLKQWQIKAETDDPEYAFNLAKSLCDDDHNSWVVVDSAKLTQEEIDTWKK